MSREPRRAVFDAGALIALERGDREMWVRLKQRGHDGALALVPTTALAQVWRGRPGQARLSLALAHCELAPFDSLARDVGVLCGKTGTVDVCDAHVALVAAARADLLYTSDPLDLRRLLVALDADVAIIAC
jgi:hypothetical protein